MQKSPGRSHLVHRQKARKLVKQYQIPYDLALSVATRQISLADALRDSENNRELERLQELHELSKGEANLVHKGELDLEELLERRRRKTHLQENAGTSIFTHALSESKDLLIWVHGNKSQKIKITEVEQYDFTLDDGQKLSKLEI